MDIIDNISERKETKFKYFITLPLIGVTIQSYQSFVLVLLYDSTVTLPTNKVSSYSHFKLISLLVLHEVVSNTYVVYHRDLPGPLAGGEQPHRRRVLHQFRGNHCSNK